MSVDMPLLHKTNIPSWCRAQFKKQRRGKFNFTFDDSSHGPLSYDTV
jgi:hypothetical protein